MTEQLKVLRRLSDELLLNISQNGKTPEKVVFSGALSNIVVVTRWRFELQTHCLKGNCSAN